MAVDSEGEAFLTGTFGAQTPVSNIDVCEIGEWNTGYCSLTTRSIRPGSVMLYQDSICCC